MLRARKVKGWDVERMAIEEMQIKLKDVAGDLRMCDGACFHFVVEGLSCVFLAACRIRRMTL